MIHRCSDAYFYSRFFLQTFVLNLKKKKNQNQNLKCDDKELEIMRTVTELKVDVCISK